MREMQINRKMRCHLEPTKWLKSGRLPIPSVDKCCEVTIILMHCWWEQKMEKPLWKTVCLFLVKLNMHLTCNPAILFLCIYATPKLKSYVQKNLYANNYGNFINNKKKTVVFPSTGEWIVMMYLHNRT